MDIEAKTRPPITISTLQRYSAIHAIPCVSASQGNFTWPAANEAIFIPFSIPFYFPISKVFWANGATLGNCDFGIYTWDGAKLFSTGSIAQSGASATQFVNVTPFILAPGKYYMALACSGTSTNIFGGTTVTGIVGRLAGLLQQTSALPLPAVATFAQFTATAYPFCGFVRL